MCIVSMDNSLRPVKADMVKAELEQPGPTIPKGLLAGSLNSTFSKNA